MVAAEMANVTIYGMECEFCEYKYDTMDELVRHLVNNHDALWDYEKPYEESLKQIKIDENFLEELRDFRNVSISEGERIECKFCIKHFDDLDLILAHVMVEHGELYHKNVKKS